MRRNAAIILFCCTSLSLAGVPQPDVALYGLAIIDGKQVASSDDVTVIARVNGNQVGIYLMGQSSTAGDRYVLRIRLESGADGSPHSDNAARVGDTAMIYLKQGNGPEDFVRDFVVSGIGLIKKLNLDTSVVPGNCAVAGTIIDLNDYAAFQSCITGPGGTASAGCDCADLDGDADVDIFDWRGFQLLFGATPQ